MNTIPARNLLFLKSHLLMIVLENIIDEQQVFTSRSGITYGTFV